ncbi:MAG: FtsX-like permease family protein [Anaerolineales bacterium]|jgi:putative ABC transport system permease protein
MTKPRWSKVLADFKDSKARSFLVIASIAVGVFAVGMIAVGYSILRPSLETTYAEAIPANITIQTMPFTPELVERIRGVPGVGVAEGRRTVTVRARSLGSDDYWEDMNLTAVEDLAGMQLKLLEPVAGTAAPPDREILLLEAALLLFGAQLGDTLEIRLADDTIRQLPIAGIINDFSAGIELSFNKRVGYITFDTLEYLHAGRYFDTLVMTVDGDADDPARVEAVAERVIEEVEESGRPILSSELAASGAHPFANYIDALIAILAFIGLLVVVLSSFLIVNTMNALMAQQLRQIGVMKLIGARRWQIIGMYLTLVLIFGVVGLLLAIPTAASAAYQISEVNAGMLNSQLATGTQVPLIPWVIALQAFIALAVPLAAAVVPIVRGAGVSVQRALSGTLIRRVGKDTWLDRWLAKVRWAKGILLLAIRNTFRRVGRLALTLFTLSLGGAIFIAVFNVRVSLEKQIDRIVAYAEADVYVQFKRPYPTDEIMRELRAFPGIVHVEAWQIAVAQHEVGQKVEGVTLMAPPDDTSIVDPSTNIGRWVIPEDQQALVVNEAFLNDVPDLEPGDKLQLKLNGKDIEWTVVGVFHYSGMNYRIAYTNFDTLSRLLNTTGHAASYRIVTHDHTLAYQRAMASALDEHFEARGFAMDYTMPLQERIDEATDKLDMIIFVLLVQASLTGVVGSIGLSGTLSLNVLERTAEIGVLRAIGAYDRLVSRLVIYEGMFIGLVSYLIGALLVIPITKLLSDMINIAIFGTPTVIAITGWGFLIWLAIMILLALVASMGPARNATRLTIREVLAYE